MLTIRFNRLVYHGQTVPVGTRALAIANFMAVSDTKIPASGSTDRGNSDEANWTTRQIGGDELMRSGWIGELVGRGLRKVGFADFNGVYASPPPGATGAAAIPRALGVFSTTVRGLYGFRPEARLQSSGGKFTVSSPYKLELRNGDNLLLEVVTGP